MFHVPWTTNEHLRLKTYLDKFWIQIIIHIPFSRSMYQYQIRADEGSVIEKGTYCYNYYMLIITYWYYDTEKNTEKRMHCVYAP